MSEQRLPPWLAPAADLAVLVVFVAVGRRTHHDESGVASFLRVLWPFGVGLLLAYLGTALAQRPLAWARVAVAWLVVVASGEALRLTVQDRPWRPGFLVIALLFIGACMFAWRLVAATVLRRHHPWSPSRSSGSSGDGRRSRRRRRRAEI